MRALFIVLACAAGWLGALEPRAPARWRNAQVIERFEDLFQPLAREAGRELRVSVLEIPWLNMGALFVPFHPVFPDGVLESITITEGVLQHPLMNEFALALALCHELGHLAAGPPYIEYPAEGALFDSEKLVMEEQIRYSAEGQADYFASAFCLKAYFQRYPPRKTAEVSPPAEELCAEEGELCLGIVHAALAWGNYLAHAGVLQQPIPSLTAPLPPAVAQTLGQWGRTPPLQCRLNTLVAGPYVLIRWRRSASRGW